MLSADFVAFICPCAKVDELAALRAKGSIGVFGQLAGFFAAWTGNELWCGVGHWVLVVYKGVCECAARLVNLPKNSGVCAAHGLMDLAPFCL